MKRVEFTWMMKFDVVQPGPVASELLAPCMKNRWSAAGKLRTVSSPTGDLCAWCNLQHVANGKQKYCSIACQQSAYCFVKPQCPTFKALVFIKKQHCMCPGCGEDFEDLIAGIINRRASWALRNNQFASQYDGVSWHLVGSSIGEKFHVDHIVPIWKGGDGIGYQNVQVLCVPCHKKKTAMEAGSDESKIHKVRKRCEA